MLLNLVHFFSSFLGELWQWKESCCHPSNQKLLSVVRCSEGETRTLRKSNFDREIPPTLDVQLLSPPHLPRLIRTLNMTSQLARTAIKQSLSLSAAARPAAISVRNYSSPPSSSTTTPSTSTTDSPTSSASSHRPTGKPQPTNLPGSNLPAAHPTRYSPLTVSLVTKLAKLFGYHSQTSTAIRTTSDYYDRCAERGEIESAFWYEGKSGSLSPLSPQVTH